MNTYLKNTKTLKPKEIVEKISIDKKFLNEIKNLRGMALKKKIAEHYSLQIGCVSQHVLNLLYDIFKKDLSSTETLTSNIKTKSTTILETQSENNDISIAKDEEKISITENQKSPIKPVISLSNEEANSKIEYENKIINLQNKINEITNENNMLNEENSKLFSKITSLTSAKDDAPLSQFNWSIEMKKLGSIMSISPNNITVTVNKNLLTECTKIIENMNLLSIYDTLKNNDDINSALIQIILLCFLYQNSLN